MRNKLLVTLITGIFLSIDAQSMDLLQVYQQALANDPVFAGARASLAAGREKIPQGRAGLLPTLGVGGSYTRTDSTSDISGLVSERNANTNTYTISLAQPLFRPANWEQYQEGKLSAAASEAQFAQARQDLIVRVAQAYFEVLAAQDALASVQTQKAAITEQLASAKRNFEVGTATITDTHEAQARFDLAVAQEFAALNDLDIKRAALQQIIGKPPGELATLKPGVMLSAPQPADINQWVQSAETQNYGVIGQQLSLEIAQREIRRNRAGHYPTVDLVASRSHTNQSSAVSAFSPGGTSDSNSIGVQWNIPLFSGFAVTSRVREAIALEDRARADLENARRTAAQGARQSFFGVASGLAQVKALEAAEVSSQSALESNRLGYQVGVRINIDVLNAQQQLYTTRRDLAKARYDTMVNGLRLRFAAGSLREEDLAQVNNLLSPASSTNSGSATPHPAAVQSNAGTLASTVPPAQTAGKEAAPDAGKGAGKEVEKEVLATLENWAKAWSERDVAGYLSFYGKNFQPAGGVSQAAWASQRRARIASKKQIEVKIEAPEIAVKGDTATVNFRQHYRDGKTQSSDNKLMTLTKEDGAWRIMREATY